MSYVVIYYDILTFYQFGAYFVSGLVINSPVVSRKMAAESPRPPGRTTVRTAVQETLRRSSTATMTAKMFSFKARVRAMPCSKVSSSSRLGMAWFGTWMLGWNTVFPKKKPGKMGDNWDWTANKWGFLVGFVWFMLSWLICRSVDSNGFYGLWIDISN